MRSTVRATVSCHLAYKTAGHGQLQLLVHFVSTNNWRKCIGELFDEICYSTNLDAVLETVQSPSVSNRLLSSLAEDDHLLVKEEMSFAFRSTTLEALQTTTSMSPCMERILKKIAQKKANLGTLHTATLTCLVPWGIQISVFGLP